MQTAFEGSTFWLAYLSPEHMILQEFILNIISYERIHKILLYYVEAIDVIGNGI